MVDDMESCGGVLVGWDQVKASRESRALLCKLGELGWLYRLVQDFVDQTLQSPASGLVLQAFCAAVQLEVASYYKSIAVLETHISQEGMYSPLSPYFLALVLFPPHSICPCLHHSGLSGLEC